MAGQIDYTLHFKVVDNLDQLVQRFRQVAAELGREVGQAGQFGAATQAAGERARGIATSQGVPSGELAKALQALEQIVRTQIQQGGGARYRREMTAGGYKQDVFTQPRVGGVKLGQEVGLGAGEERAARKAFNTKMRTLEEAQKQEALTGDKTYTELQKRVAVAKRKQLADLQQALADDETYRTSTRQLATARKQQAAELTESKNADPEYQRWTLELARQRELAKAMEAESLAADTQYQAATVRAAIAREQSKAALASDPKYAAAQAKAASAKEQQTARVREALAADEKYISAQARAARANEELAAKVTLTQAGMKYEGMDRRQLLAASATAKRTEADLQAAAAARAMLHGDQRATEAAVQKTLAEAQVTAALKRRERDEIRAQIRSGQAAGTTGYQRLQGYVLGRAPGEMQTGPQQIAQKTITSAGYMAGGAISGAALFGTIEAVKEASKLQEMFAGLRGQMDSLGQSGAFAEVRDGIKSISSETGIAASEVTKFASRLLGVFNDPARAVKETAAAMKLAVVSGTDLATMIEELVPIADLFGVSIEHIGDLAVSIHDKFGIAEEATLHFLGEVAPLAEEAGLSLEEMGVLGATAANTTGKSIKVAAEQFSKVLPTMQQNQDKLFQILRSNPDTAANVDPIVEAFGKGESGEAFKLILKSYDQLNSVQQDNLVRVSGSRREWALLNGLFSNSGKLLSDMEDAEAGVGQTTGGLERRFAAVSVTLSRSIERLQEGFKNLVEGFLASGLGDALALIGKSLEMIVGLVNVLVGAFMKLNEVTANIPLIGGEGLLTPMVQFAAAAYAASKAMKVFNAVRAGGKEGSLVLTQGERELTVAIGQRTQATVQGEATLATDTVAKQSNAVVTGELAAAEGGLATTRGAGAVTAGFTGIPSGGAARPWRAGEGLVRYGDRFVNPATGATVLPPPPVGAGAAGAGGVAASLQGSRAMQRLFAGGAIGKGTGFMQGLTTAGAEAGTKAGIGPFMGVALPVIAGVMVKGKYDETKGELQEAGNNLREQFKKASEEDVENFSNDYGDMFDKFQEDFFQEDLPGTIARAEKYRRRGARGAVAAGVLTERKWVDRFSKDISEDRLNQINTMFNTSDQLRQYAADELGANMEGNIAEKTIGLGRKLGLNAPTGLGKGEVKVTRENLKEILPKIKERAEKGEEGAAQLAFQIEQEIANNRTMVDIRKAVGDAVAKGDVNKAIEEAGGIDQFLQLQGLYDPEGMLQTGQIGRGQYIAIVEQKVIDLRKQLAGAPDQEKAQKELDQAMVRAQQARDQFNQERVDQVKRISAITSVTPKAATMKEEIKRLPAMSMPTQIAKIPDLLQGRWDAFQEELDQIQDPNEWYQRALAGVKVDPETQILQLIRNIKDSPTFGPLADQIKGQGQSQDDFFRELAKKRQETGRDLRDILYEVGAARLQPVGGDKASPEWEKFKESLAGMTDQQIADLNNYVDILKTPQQLLDRAKAEKDATVATAHVNLRAAQAGTSPMAAAQAELEKANIELEKLTKLKDTGAGGATIDAEIENAQANVVKAQMGVATVEHQVAAAMDQWAVVYAAGDPVKEANAELVAAINQSTRILEENVGDLKDPKYIESLQQQERVRQKQIDAQNAITRAAMELGAFDRDQDPEAAARDARLLAEFQLRTAKGDAERLQAQLAIKQADRQALEAAQEAGKARRELLAFDREQDPVAAAQEAINEAHIAIGEARGKGSAEQDRAALNLKQAYKQMTDAQEAIFAADAQFAITMANIRQDPVEAARLTILEAQRRLAAAYSQNKGDAEIRQLTGELEQARSDAIDTAVQEQEDVINFMLEMGQITQGQAIERLKVERDKYAVGTKKWRDLQLKIRSMEQSAQSDLQFNLPTELALPTLYEARRLTQSNGMGVGYQDNRNTAIVVNVNGAQDPSVVTNQVVAALQSAVGGGPVYAPQVPVGVG